MHVYELSSKFKYIFSLHFFTKYYLSSSAAALPNTKNTCNNSST